MTDEIKPKSKTKKQKKTKRDWSDQEVRELITLWTEKEVLYNLKHENNYNKNEKQKARKRIASQLISCGFSEIEDAQICEKITLLHGCYSTENRKEKVSKASGARNLRCLCEFLEVYKRLRLFECQFNSKKKVIQILILRQKRLFHLGKVAGT